MTGRDFWDQVLLSLSDPAEAARRVIAFGAARDVVWTALFLTAVLSSMTFVLSGMTQPDGVPLSPTAHLAFTLAGAVGSAGAVTLIGRLFGGQGRFDTVLVIFVWLQVLQVLFQMASFVIGLALPGLAVILVFVSIVYGLYITVHFIDQAHGLGSPLKALGVLVAASVVLAFILSFLLVLIWGDSLGVPANV